MIKNKIKKTGVKRTGKIAEYQRKGQAIIKRGINAGHKDTMLEVLGTLDATELVKSKRGLEKLKQDMKYVRQLPKIREENAKRDADFQNKRLVKEAEQLIAQQATEVINKYGEKVLQALNDSKKYGKLGAFKDMDELTSQKKSSSQAVEKMNKDLKDIINELERKSLKDCAEDMLVNDIKTFFNDYFKSIKLKYQDREKIDILIERFKNNLADYNDFVEYVTDLSWTDDYESEREKYYNPLGFVEEMRDRLDRMVELSKTGEYRKTLKK